MSAQAEGSSGPPLAPLPPKSPLKPRGVGRQRPGRRGSGRKSWQCLWNGIYGDVQWYITGILCVCGWTVIGVLRCVAHQFFSKLYIYKVMFIYKVIPIFYIYIYLYIFIYIFIFLYRFQSYIYTKLYRFFCLAILCGHLNTRQTSLLKKREKSSSQPAADSLYDITMVHQDRHGSMTQVSAHGLALPFGHLEPNPRVIWGRIICDVSHKI